MKLTSRYPARIWTSLTLAMFLAIAPTACKVEQTKEAKAPDLDVDVDPGRWPKYNVNWADVDVGTTTRTVTVPEFEIKREKVQMEVPYIDVKGPGATDMEERTVTMDLQVPHSGYSLQIAEIRATGNRLWVIGELKETGAAKGRAAATRAADQVVINAPEDLDVRKVIIGQRPEGVYNQQYTFMSDRGMLDQKLKGSRVIYSRGA